MAASAGLPRNTPQAPVSGAGAHRAAGRKLIYTVVEPFMIGGCGPGGGGWASPALMTPVHMHWHVTVAAGIPSIITRLGGGPVIGGPITPQGTNMS